VPSTPKAPQAVPRIQDSRDRQFFVERDLLWHDAHDSLRARGITPEIRAIDFHFAGVRPQQARDHGNGRGLSRAVRTEQPVDFSRLDFEIHLLDGPALRRRLWKVR
jgi:hypothetical protein